MNRTPEWDIVGSQADNDRQVMDRSVRMKHDFLTLGDIVVST